MIFYSKIIALPMDVSVDITTINNKMSGQFKKWGAKPKKLTSIWGQKEGCLQIPTAGCGSWCWFRHLQKVQNINRALMDNKVN